MIIKQQTTLLKLLLLSALSAILLLVATTPQRTLAAGLKTSSSSVSGYQRLGGALGRGGVEASMVGPGATASGQSFYQVYTYVDGTLDLVTIDPDTGIYHAYASPVSSEQGAWGITVGSDKNIYIGTLPGAHLMKFDTRSNKLVDLGRVPADPQSGVQQSYFWGLTTSPHNGKMYGCTYPSADLVSYNPLDAKPKIVNLGTMDPTGKAQYNRFCIADTDSNNPYVNRK